MSALGTWAPSAASQESKAPEALTHGEGSASKAGGVGPVTAALPWERQVLTKAVSQPGAGISSSSMKTRALVPWALSRARLRPATIPGSGSWM